jgi:hypothetical protein
VQNDEHNLIVELTNNWLNQFQFCQNVSFSWVSISVQVKSDNVHPVVVESVGPINGILTGGGTVPFCAAVFKLHTSSPGRHGRGRIMMPGVHGQSIANGAVEANAQIVYNGCATAIFNRYKLSGPSSWKLVVFDRTTQTGFLHITSIEARNTFGCVARRKIGRGV